MLRKEVNYGCPIRNPDGTGCGCPILTYHHFDPPWEGNFKHNPPGMIALCPQHHNQADGGLWSKDQLRQFKKHPYVDDVMRVQWPWGPETLVMKVGSCLVLGSGSPIRLDGLPVMRFHPHVIEGLPGARTTIFDSDIRDTRQNRWLRISDGWLDLSVNDTDDLIFTPQTKTFVARHGDGTFISMKFQKYSYTNFADWVYSFIANRKVTENLRASVEKCGAIDNEGSIPVISFEGKFRTDKIAVHIEGNKMHFELFLPGHHEAFDWPSYIVDEEHSIRVHLKGKSDFFTMG